MSRMLFVNLPVQDVTRTAEFFGALGFEFAQRFSDDNAACMVINEHACVMLLVERFFASFTTNNVADPAAGTGAILALSADSRADVDVLVDRAVALGGRVAQEPADEGYMYGRSFYDLDGHAWEVIWMDAGAAA
jgi:uncharacterized protein